MSALESPARRRCLKVSGVINSNENQECQTATHRKMERTRRRKSGVNKAKSEAENWQQKTSGSSKLDNWPQQIPGTTSEISADAWSHGASGGGPGSSRDTGMQINQTITAA